MNSLRWKLEADLKIRNYAEQTQTAYLARIAQVTDHFGRCPSTLGIEDVRQYLRHLLVERPGVTIRLRSNGQRATVPLRIHVESARSDPSDPVSANLEAQPRRSEQEGSGASPELHEDPQGPHRRDAAVRHRPPNQ